MVFLLSLFFGIVGLAESSRAATYNIVCSGDISTAMQDAIRSAINGDTINISAGSCSMSGTYATVDVTDKNIEIKGAGKDLTTISISQTFAFFTTTGANSPTWTLHGFTYRYSGHLYSSVYLCQ